MSVKKKYTHIFFDLDNTLWDFEKNSRFAMKSTFELYSLKKQNIKFSDFFEIYQKNNHNLWAAYRKKDIYKKELIKKRFQLTLNSLQIKGIDPVEMNATYLSEMPKQKYLNEGAVDILEYLKFRRYRLFIITNGFKEVQHEKLHSSGLMSFFEKVFVSEEVRTPKPGREIFEYAIKSSNAKKADSLMIGDDWDVDIIGASKFGIDSVYYPNNIEKDSDILHLDNNTTSKNYKILSLKELKEIV